MTRSRKERASVVGVSLSIGASFFLVIAQACTHQELKSERQPVTLRIGYGLAPGTTPQSGALGAAKLLALDPLVSVRTDGRLAPRLAESWSTSEDGLTVRIRLRGQARFHDGRPADAEMLSKILQAQLPQDLGPLFEDIKSIRAISDRDVEFSLRRRSSFLMERLDSYIQAPGAAPVGTGPFYVTAQSPEQIELRANAQYFAATPSVDRVVIKPYGSVRAAWADLLRNQVDMLYDVGVDALDSLESSSQVKVYTFQRGYAYLLMLNLRKPYLQDPSIRRKLNAAINRDEIVKDVLRGHATPADGVVWPHHWTYTSEFPKFSYEPRLIEQNAPRRLVCLFNEPSYERLALLVQRQLQAVGIDLELKLVSGSDLMSRLTTGDFDLFLSDFVHGPTLGRPYLYWYSGGPYNFGQFRSAAVDKALDSIRDAPNDAAYKAAALAFQQAIVNDPPAVFLAWRERARVVSRRFEVPTEANIDILTALHLWRPATEERTARRN